MLASPAMSGASSRVVPGVTERSSRWLRRAVATASAGLGAPAVLRNIVGRTDVCVVLAYHSIAQRPRYASGEIAVPPELFRAQIAFLSRHYVILSVDDLADRLRAGAALPRGAVAITFDDGYLDNFLHACPALVDHRASAAFFVTTDPVLDCDRFWVGWLTQALNEAPGKEVLAKAAGRPVSGPEEAFDRLSERINAGGRRERDALLAEVATAVGAADPPRFMVNAGEMRQMAEAGMTIGSHTRSHPILCSLSDDELAEELAGSRAALTGALGRAVDFIAYPNGRAIPRNFDERVIGAARRAGYRAAFTSRRGPLRLGDDPLAIRRLGVRRQDGISGLALKIERFRVGL